MQTVKEVLLMQPLGFHFNDSVVLEQHCHCKISFYITRRIAFYNISSVSPFLTKTIHSKMHLTVQK